MANDKAPRESGEEHPKRDFDQMFDLNRSTVIKNYVSELEERFRAIEVAQGDLKAIAEAAKEHEFSPKEVLAMKRIARLRLKDKGPEAKQELAALERIGKAVDFDLFDFAGAG
jgi:hypothetical protein